MMSPTTLLRVHGDGWLTASSRRYRCALGRGGIRRDKQEGDGATPAGRFPLRRLYYRPDRIGRPVSGLPAQALAADDGWCDAPDDRAYNRAVKLPYAASAERMWRDDHLYDLVIVVGHNDDPPRPGAGSAIFMHLAQPDYGATEGCIALAREDLLELLPALSAATALEIVGAVPEPS